MELPTGRTERIDIGGRSLDVWLAGDSGPTVLLVHGIPTNHGLWRDVVPAIAPYARVVAVDLLGYGRSDPPDGWDVDLASQASYLLTVLDVLDRPEAIVVGHDLGGGIAQILATTSGGRITGMGVVNGVCYDAWPVPLVRLMKATWPALRLAPAPAVDRVLRVALRTLFARPAAAAAFLDGFATPWSRPGAPAVLAQHLRSLDSVYTRTVAPFLPRLTMPVEIVWGRLDHQLASRYGRRLAGDIPGARLTWVPDASHFVPADRPDAVVDAVLALVRRA